MTLKKRSIHRKPAAYISGLLAVILIFLPSFSVSSVSPISRNPQTSVALSGAADSADFDVFYGESADTGGLQKATFADHFITADGCTKHSFDTSKITDYWAQQDKYVSSAVYNKKAYRNFEMECTVQGNDNNNVAYYWPMLVFGIEDPTKWVQQDGGGFATFAYNDGNTGMKGFVNGTYTNTGDPTQRHDYSQKDTQGYFESQGYVYKLKIVVSGSQAIVTVIPQYGWGVQYSYTYNLGNNYTGGYVGFASTGQQCKFWNFKVTDLGGEVRMDASSTLQNLSNDAYLFDTYYGESADTSGLYPATFTDHFSLNGYLQHSFDTSKITDYWAQQDKYVTTAVYNRKAYRNFQMECTVQGKDNNVAYYWPMLVFGIEDPTKWVQQDGGGFATFAYNDGNTGMKGFVNGAYVNTADPIHHKDAQGYFEAQSYVYKLKLVVSGSSATVTVIPQYDWGVQYSYTYNLGSNYTGGYVGFASTGQLCRFWDFKVTDLGGEVRMDAASSLIDAGKNEYLFDVYSGENADVSGLTDAALSDQFEINNQMLMHKFDTAKVTDWRNQQDKFITTALYNRETYRNFEMQVTCQGQNSGALYYWPMLVFGVEDPGKWVNQSGGGFAAYVYNEGNSALKGYVNGQYTNRYDPTLRNVFDKKDVNGFFEAQWCSYTLKLRVENHTATVTVIPNYEWGVPYSYSFKIGNSYQGGYVGFASTGQNCKFVNFKVTDLGDECVEIGTPGDANNDSLFDFNDMTISKKVLLGIISENAQMYLDVNNDGVYNIIDIVKMKKKLIGIA